MLHLSITHSFLRLIDPPPHLGSDALVHVQRLKVIPFPDFGACAQAGTNLPTGVSLGYIFFHIPNTNFINLTHAPASYILLHHQLN